MQPAPVAKLWPVPAIETTAALADWLWLEPEELACYADLKQLWSRSQDEALRHNRLAFRVKQEFKGFSVQQVTVKLLRIFWAACAQRL